MRQTRCVFRPLACFDLASGLFRPSTGQTQRQLTIPADMAIDEIFQFERYVAPFKTEATQDFLCDGLRHILGAIGLGIEHDHPERVRVLPAHQIADGGLQIGAAKIGLCERDAVSAIAIDDDIELLGRARNNRGVCTHTQQLPLYGQRLLHCSILLPHETPPDGKSGSAGDGSEDD